MSASRGTRVGSVVLLLALGFAGCRGCGCGDTSVGQLLMASAQVERDFAAAVNAWSPAQVGDRFAIGDGLRTGPTASAQLGLQQGGRLLVKPSTTMRFTRDQRKDGGRRIEVVQGDVTIETGELDIGVETARGVVKLMPESQVEIRAGGGKIRFDVLIGRVEYGDGDSRQVALAGRSFELEVLTAMAEPGPVRAAEPTPEPPPAVEDPDPDPVPGAGAGPAIRDLRFAESPPNAVFTLPVGEHASVHDPLPPTDVRIPAPRCPALAVVEFDRGNGRFDALRVRGTGELRARVPAGNYRYRIRCVRNGRLELSSAGSGRVSILRDVATRPLPSQPVTITADADGRRYTVSYQNRLPVITLRWPDAPASGTYTLTVSPERGNPFSLHSPKANVTLAAGRLGEGLHRFQFEAGAKRSEMGQLRVAFDYKARTAYLTSPVEGQRAEGDLTRVAGGTLIGSAVQVLGVPVKLDTQGRFAAEVAVPPSAKGVVVRVQHPSTGIHYYVRHLTREDSGPVAQP